jgi:hypothetical protein
MLFTGQDWISLNWTNFFQKRIFGTLLSHCLLTRLWVRMDSRGRFYREAWQVIKVDFMVAMDRMMQGDINRLH